MSEILSLLVPLAINAFGAVEAAIARGRASGELTAEQEASYRSQINDVFNKDYAQTDAQRKAAAGK